MIYLFDINITIGFTVDGFLFTLKNLSNNLKAIVNPSKDLINIERGAEEVENTLTKDLFYDIKRINNTMRFQQKFLLMKGTFYMIKAI